MDYQQLYRNSTGRTTTPRPRGQRNWWDNLKDAFSAPADGSAPGMATGSGSTGTYQTSYGTQNRSDANPGAFDKGIQNIQQTDYSSMIPDGAYSTSYGGGNINDDNQTVRNAAPIGNPPTTMSETQSRGYSSYDVATGGAGSTVNTTTPGPSGPVTGSSGYSLYGMADGELKNSETERISDIQAGTTTAAPGGTTTPAPGGTTTPAPDEIDGIDLEQAGQDAYQRNLANILGGIDTRKQAAGEGFSDLYQQFKDQKTMQDSMTDPRGLTGGMERQEGARQSAAEIGAMTDLASQRQRAVDQIEAEKMTAELEAGRMTAEQYELDKQTNPAWEQGNLLAQKYNETGDMEDFNEYMGHMSSLLGIEPSLVNINDPEAAVAQVSENAVTRINQYIQNPTLMQQLFGYGSSGLMAGLGAKIGMPALAKLGGVLLGKAGATTAGTLVTAGAFPGVLVGGAAGAAGKATVGGAAALAAKLGLGTAAAALGPALGVAIGAGLAVAGIIGIVNNVRRGKTGEAAEEAVAKVFEAERKRIIGEGFTEAEADEAIDLIKQTLPTSYRES